jgi:hypothetical protein
MKLAFDFDAVQTTEFGVGRDNGDGQTFCCVAVDAGVQAALREMAETTQSTMQELSDTPSRYEPS